MSNQKDGGQAFPGIDIVCGDNALGSKGMSLRDWFAGQASETDVLAHMDREMITREEAKYAYADAMLKARGE
jgi:hypothetical protein